MKNKKIVLFFIPVLFILFNGCQKAEIKNRDSRGKTIVCFGDSITAGYGVTLEESYPSALERLSKRKIINAGVDGDTTLQALKRIDSDVLSRGPYLVIVEFGGNDFLKKLPLSETEVNIRKIVRSIEDSGAMVALVDISAGVFLGEYHAILSRVARQEGALFIPQALKGILTNPSYKSDFFHPNAKGYAIVAQRVYRAAAGYLKAQ